MALDYNQFAGSLLSSLGSGLMSAGSGGWNNFAPGFIQGQQMYTQNRNDMLDRQQRAKLQALQEEQIRLALEQQRTANQDKVKRQQDWEKLTGGFMSPNGMSQAQFGGAPMQPGLMSQDFTPEQMSFLRALPPDQGMGIVAEQMFKQTDPVKWDIEKIREGNKEVAYRINPYTGERVKLGEGAAFAPPAQTTVNVGPSGIDYGDPEAGLAWARNADGSVKLDERGAPIAVPYQGSKAYNEMIKTGETKASANEAKAQTADIVTTDIDRALQILEQPGLPTTGFVGNMLSNVGGTNANDLRALVDTVKANIGIDKLQAMRASSPTGGALGSVTEKETAFLQAALGNLEQSQTESQYKENLKRVKDIYLKIIHGPGASGVQDLNSQYGTP